MKEDQIYTCEKCGLELKIIKTCDECGTSKDDCGCDESDPCVFRCCGSDLKLK